mmetsp:Transcript_52831/g.123463  ORF Transcript_52831/g.123463 Transcript_52831/m.123463 type:complete len:117 (+) Transcript_52831:201-551(+)
MWSSMVQQIATVSATVARVLIGRVPQDESAEMQTDRPFQAQIVGVQFYLTKDKVFLLDVSATPELTAAAYSDAVWRGCVASCMAAVPRALCGAATPLAQLEQALQDTTPGWLELAN